MSDFVCVAGGGAVCAWICMEGQRVPFAVDPQVQPTLFFLFLNMVSH